MARRARSRFTWFVTAPGSIDTGRSCAAWATDPTTARTRSPPRTSRRAAARPRVSPRRVLRPPAILVSNRRKEDFMTNVRAPEGAHALVGDPSEAASWDVARDRLTSRSGTGIRVGSRPCNATAAHTDVGGAGAEIRTRTAFSP